MKSFVYTVNCIENGILEYNTVKVFNNKEEAINTARAEIKAQCEIWKTEPYLFRKVQGFFCGYQVKSPLKESYVKTYIVQVSE